MLQARTVNFLKMQQLYQDSFKFLVVLSEVLPYNTSRPRHIVSLSQAHHPFVSCKDSRVSKSYMPGTLLVFPLKPASMSECPGRAAWSCGAHPGVSASDRVVQGQTRQLTALSPTQPSV